MYVYVRTCTDNDDTVLCCTRICMTTAHLHTPNLGGPAQLKLAQSFCISRSPILSCMSYPFRTSWGNCPWFQPETTAPFPGTCTAARKRAIRWACATVRVPLAREPPVLHQIVGHDLASRLQEGWLLRDEH